MCKYNNNNKRIKKRIEEFHFMSLINLTSIAGFYRIKVISLTPKKM